MFTELLRAEVWRKKLEESGHKVLSDPYPLDERYGDVIRKREEEERKISSLRQE